MSVGTGIEWTSATWNPVVGCTRVSAGCDNCYAVKQSYRLAEMRQQKYMGLTVLNGKGERHFNGVVRTSEHSLTVPLGWKKPRRIFVNSMSDLFHKDVPEEFIDRVFAVMALTPHHTYQILTKRPERMAAYLNVSGLVRRVCAGAEKLHRESCHLSGPEFSAANTRKFRGHMKKWWEHVGRLCAWLTDGGCASDTFKRNEPDREYPSWVAWPLPNVWLGTSVEDQAAADERIPHLLRCPAAVRFLSVEPLLERVSLTASGWWRCSSCANVGKNEDEVGWGRCPKCGHELDTEDELGVDWVIVGGESGPNARPCNVEWVRNIVSQCATAAIPCFVKQLGRHPYDEDYDLPRPGKIWGPPDPPAPPKVFLELTDKKGGDIDEFPDDLRIRQFPEAVPHA